MNPDDFAHALACIEAGVNNGARIKMIVAEGHGQSNRDVALAGLSVEDSTAVLEAVASVLKSKSKKAKV